jgi:hypothetical protein
VAAAVKLLFDSLDALLTELRDRRIELVRVSPALEIETGPRTAGVPHLVSRVLVTAPLDDWNWAEWRYWVGQAIAEIDRSRVEVPAWLRENQARALAEVARRVDEASFLVREGILTHDQGVMDVFRL